MNGALLFDLDGTLTNPSEGITKCIRYALDSIGAVVPAQDDLERWIGPPLHESLRDYLGAPREHLVPEALSAYRRRFSDVGMFENAVYAAIPEALADLQRRGCSLFEATSKPTTFAERIVDHFGLSTYFSAVYGSELSGERSDKAELIAHLLRTEGIHSSRATMIGDRAHDIVGARRNDLRAVGVLWGYGDEAELVGAGAHAVVATVPELLFAI